MRENLAAALRGVRRGRAAADQLCASFVSLLDVDGAALAVLMSRDVMSRSMGSGGSLSHELMELQFMLGEGPTLQSMTTSAPVMAGDLHGVEARQWPQFAAAAVALGVGAVFAFPVTAAGAAIGALLLHRNRSGPLTGAALIGAFFAADLAALPILDVIGMDLDAGMEDETSGAWEELAALTRSEVYQAAGVLIGQLDVTPTEALVRLRAHAFAQGQTASEAAYDILEYRVRLDYDQSSRQQPEEGTDGHGA